MAPTLDIDWIPILLLLLAAGGGIVAALFPYRTVALARANARGPDRTRDIGQAKVELRHFGQFLADALLVPLSLAVFLGTALLALHLWVIPLPLAADILGAYAFDPIAWEYAIEHEGLGDTGATYEAWGHSQGYSAERSRFFQEFLWRNWAFVLLLGLVGGGFMVWFVFRYYLRAVEVYHKGVVDRAAPDVPPHGARHLRRALHRQRR